MDQQLQILINRVWVAPWSDRLLSFISNYSAWAPILLLFLVLGLLFGSFKFRAMILTAGLAVGISDGIFVNGLKHLVARPRPIQVESGVRVVEMGGVSRSLPRILGLSSPPRVTYPLGKEIPKVWGIIGKEVTGKSFPSGHAANNMAVATVILLFYPRRGWIYLPIALLIAYSRIYTGAHWPLDVLAGMLLGVAGGWLAVRGIRTCWRNFGSRIFPRHAMLYPELLG